MTDQENIARGSVPPPTKPKDHAETQRLREESREGIERLRKLAQQTEDLFRRKNGGK